MKKLDFPLWHHPTPGGHNFHYFESTPPEDAYT